MSLSENHHLAADWQAVWQLHSKWLRTVLVARLRDGLVADELLQEVCVIAWRKHEQLEDQQKLAPWLYRIAIRQVQMFWRSQATKQKRWQTIDSEQNQTPDQKQVDPLSWIVSQESHQQVRDAMHQLGSQDREILMLKHTEDWTYQQIASFLGISMDKVIYRIGRAQKRLRGQLTGLEAEWGNQ